MISYLLCTLALVVTPGATTAVVVRNTLGGGRAAGWATALGAALGNTSHALGAGLGLALLVARWPSALVTVKFVGAAYLAWLGVVSVWRAVTIADGGLPVSGSMPPIERPAQRRSFRQGLTVNLLNPSIAIFYLVVVPSFLPSDAARSRFVVLAAIHVSMALASHGVWVMALHRVRAVFHRPVARRALEALSGLALIGLALRVWL